MLTPTQLIFKAYQTTPKPLPLPNGKTAEWPLPEMHEVPDELCWLCGGRTDHFGRLRKDAVRDSFTDARHGSGSRAFAAGVAGSWHKFIETGPARGGWQLSTRHATRSGRYWSSRQQRTRGCCPSRSAGETHIIAGKVVLSPNSIWVLLEQTLSDTAIRDWDYVGAHRGPLHRRLCQSNPDRAVSAKPDKSRPVLVASKGRNS